MSREIKFRAWSLEQRAMIYPSETGWFEKAYRGSHVALQSVRLDTVLISPYLKAMQYTGLNDKNGVEIYEGDILSVWHEDEYVPNRDSGGGIIDYYREEGFSQLGIVGFTGCSFDYKTAKTIDGKHEEIHMPIDWIENYKVVGNIYENPELLSNSDTSKTQ